MKYKVYSYGREIKQIDETDDELDVIDTIGYAISNDNISNYMVVKHNEEKDEDIPYKLIKNRLDYVRYFQEVEEQLRNKGKIKELKK